MAINGKDRTKRYSLRIKVSEARVSKNLFTTTPSNADASWNPGFLALGALFFTPAFCLVGFWVGGELGLTIIAVLVPTCAAFSVFVQNRADSAKNASGNVSDPKQNPFEQETAAFLKGARQSGQKSAVFAVRLDDFEILTNHHGSNVMDDIARQAFERIRAALRGDDILGFLDTATFGICIKAKSHFDLESCLELAGRVNRAIAEPYSVDGAAIYVTSSIGFCQLGRETAREKEEPRDPVSTCAQVALSQALQAAPSAVRAYAHEKQATTPKVAETDLDVVAALENGEIIPWFQPQISTDTGRITGFEALARWIHPVRGPISPAEFLPMMEQKALMGRLSEVMLYHAMSSLKAWDKANVGVQQVGVNFSPAELHDPKLVEKISWELDRFELSPDRLAVEILETVVARGPDDVVTHNIKGLRAMGCHIDLDDFGTGHASLKSIRRFGVGRIKIDRTFVMKADRDIEQQRMIRAILTLAEKLDIETLAEGVETVGEHSLLAQLGCNYVQGFGIGRPMPFEDTFAWIQEHNSKLQDPPDIGRATG